MATPGRSQQNGSGTHAGSPPALESSSSSDTGEDKEEEEEDEEEEDESIAVTRPRREHRAPQSLYVAPTVLRKRKLTAAEINTTERNKRRRIRRQQLREQARQQAASDALMAEAEQEEEPDNDGRDAFMAAAPAKRAARRKSLFGTRRRTRAPLPDERADGLSGKDTEDVWARTQSDDERRQAIETEPGEEGNFSGERREPRYARMKQEYIDWRARVDAQEREEQDEPRFVIHLRWRLRPGRDAGGKFCGIRRYKFDRVTGLPSDDELPSPAPRSRSHSPPQQNGHEQSHSDDDSESTHNDARRQPAATAASSSASARPRRPRRTSQAVSENGEADGARQERSQSAESSKASDGRGAAAEIDTEDLQVKLEKMHEVDAQAQERRESARRQRSASGNASSAPTAVPSSAAATRSAYAQHSLTSAPNNGDSSEYSARQHDPSPLSPSRYPFDRTDAAGHFVAPPPPATFPPSPPASPPASPRVMRVMRSMPSLEYDIANVRAGIHPLYLSALEQIDALRLERQVGVERLKRERLAHVDELYAAEMKQCEEEWKDEARGLQQRIIDRLTAQHRTRPGSPSASASAAARTTRRRHQQLLDTAASSRAVLKRYHAEYCLPAAERRADLERCRRLIEEGMGEEEGGEVLRRVDVRLEKRRERAGVWRRHHNREVDALASRKHEALTQRQRSANGRFQ